MNRLKVWDEPNPMIFPWMYPHINGLYGWWWWWWWWDHIGNFIEHAWNDELMKYDEFFWIFSEIQTKGVLYCYSTMSQCFPICMITHDIAFPMRFNFLYPIIRNLPSHGFTFIYMASSLAILKQYPGGDITEPLTRCCWRQLSALFTTYHSHWKWP